MTWDSVDNDCLKYRARQYLESVNCGPVLAVRELNHSVAQSRKSDWYSRPGKKRGLRRRWFIWLDLDERERHGAGPLAEHGLPSYCWFLSGLRSYEQRESDLSDVLTSSMSLSQIYINTILISILGMYHLTLSPDVRCGQCDRLSLGWSVVTLVTGHQGWVSPNCLRALTGHQS